MKRLVEDESESENEIENVNDDAKDEGRVGIYEFAWQAANLRSRRALRFWDPSDASLFRATMSLAADEVRDKEMSS